MTKEQALDRLSTTKTISRDKFIFDMIKESAGGTGRAPSREEIQNFGALYDSATSSAGGSPAASGPQATVPSASGAPKNSDKYGKLFFGG